MKMENQSTNKSIFSYFKLQADIILCLNLYSIVIDNLLRQRAGTRVMFLGKVAQALNC